MPRVIVEIHRTQDRMKVRLGDSEVVMSIREAKELMRAIDGCISDVMYHAASVSAFKPVFIYE